jgi:hypothetical protein
MDLSSNSGVFSSTPPDNDCLFALIGIRKLTTCSFSISTSTRRLRQQLAFTDGLCPLARKACALLSTAVNPTHRAVNLNERILVRVVSRLPFESLMRVLRTHVCDKRPAERRNVRPFLLSFLHPTFRLQLFISFIHWYTFNSL